MLLFYGFILVARPVVLLSLPVAHGISLWVVNGWNSGRKNCSQRNLAAGLGLIIGTIGEGPFNGELRMSSYDYPYLTDGLKLVIVGLGIFAVPEIIALLRKDKAISDRPVLGVGGSA